MPRIVYPTNKSFVFHQRVTELLFADQPILQALALENALITVSAGTGLNHIQRNVIREWLSRPVSPDHPVYRAAIQYISEAESDAAVYWSEPNTRLRRRRTVIPPGLLIGWEQLRRGFQSAVEASRRPGWPRKKKNNKKKRYSCGKRPTAADREEREALIDSRESPAYETQELFIFNDASSDVVFTVDQSSSSTTFIQQAAAVRVL